METPKYKVGMLIQHKARPEWGPGRIVALDEARLHVFFKGAIARTAKTFMRELAPLTVAESQSDEVLDTMPPAVLDANNWVLPRNYEKLMKRAATAAAAAG